MNDIAVIHLTNGGFCVVDTADFECLSRHNWQLSSTGYVHRGGRIGKKTTPRLMHREVIGADSGVRVDHRNRFRIDNRRSNLRIATPSMNGANASKAAGKSSRFKGVCWATGKKKWKAQIKLNYKNHFIGYFNSETDAARAYNKQAQKLFGEFAALNEV